ncbi:MAG: glycosyltransferase [Salinivirgaceae bacterium]|nr:glycosyltransferase [Salinivirgaceae bacterium]MDD4746090.1 glycosyltransferase [Salinivirgaceae bacterium]MDY0281095.1 glycosyltransferase [Salinivirgaceae bacterium]
MYDYTIIIINYLTSNWEFLLFATFCTAVAIQIMFYLFIYFRVILHKNKNYSTTQNPISVVICARNEEENLEKNLPLICNQDHPNHEVFVILDACTDNSLYVMENLIKTNSNLRYSTIVKDSKFSHGKKLALTVGIKGAQNNTLLLTDADCYPISTDWIKYMTSHIEKERKIVLGYGKYEPEKGILNPLIRYDAFFIAQQYLGFALAGIPYMGVGRNLAYTKDIYTSQKGFSSHAHIESGDDDLLINAAAKRKNCIVEINHKAHTMTKAPKTLKKWKQQKRRHLTTAHLYKKTDKILLALEPTTRLLTWFAPIPLYFIPEWQIPALILSLARFMIFITITKLNMYKLNERGLWLLSPIFDIILPLFSAWFIIKNHTNKKPISWK